MSELETITVAPDDWLSTAQDYQSQGFEYLDFLSVRELESGAVVVSAHLVALPPQAAGAVKRVIVESEWSQSAKSAIDSVASVFPGARWHELEASELFGISFGHDWPAGEPFIASEPALERNFALDSRLETTWPGTNEPGLAPDHPRRKRKRAVPGNSPSWEDNK